MGIDSHFNNNHGDRDKVENILSHFNLNPKIVDRFYEIYEEYNYCRGRAVEATVGGIIFAAAREANEPITLHNLANELEMDVRYLNTAYKSITHNTSVESHPCRPEDFLDQAKCDLNLPDKAEEKGKEIINKIRENDGIFLAGKKPSAIAAAVLYYAANKYTDHKITKKAIADKLSTTPGTISRNVGIIENGRDSSDSKES